MESRYILAFSDLHTQEEAIEFVINAEDHRTSLSLRIFAGHSLDLILWEFATTFVLRIGALILSETEQSRTPSRLIDCRLRQTDVSPAKSGNAAISLAFSSAMLDHQKRFLFPPAKSSPSLDLESKSRAVTR
jgi:hypothetical protein